MKRNLETLILPGILIEKPTGYLSKDEFDFPDEEKAFGTWTYPDSRLEFSNNIFLVTFHAFIISIAINI